MKKSLLIAMFALVCGTMAYAQPRAIGVNLGGGAGFSYQHGFGEANMLDIDVHTSLLNAGYGWWGIGAHITYDWIDPFGAKFPELEKGEFHWAMGVGGSGGIKDFSNGYWYAGVAGHVGVAYDFWFPLELSLDWRPSIGVSNAYSNWFNTPGLFEGICLGVRYRFGQK